MLLLYRVSARRKPSHGQLRRTCISASARLLPNRFSSVCRVNRPEDWSDSSVMPHSQASVTSHPPRLTPRSAIGSPAGLTQLCAVGVDVHVS